MVTKGCNGSDSKLVAMEFCIRAEFDGLADMFLMSGICNGSSQLGKELVAR